MPAEEVADEEIEAEGSENRANAEDEVNNNSDGEDEEIEENREAKDNEKVSLACFL